jgi:hypothetical protein
MEKYWRCGLAAAAVVFSAHGAWAQSVTGCPAGQAMQSSDPSGKSITCVPIPDTAALQQQITNEANARQAADTALTQQIANEAAARQAADSALGARIDALTEADIVGKWAVSGTTTCLGSSTGFSTEFMSPIVPGPGLPSAFVSQLTGTFIGTRTFIAGGTGHADGTSHTMSFPATFHGTLTSPPPPPASPLFAGVSTNPGGASTATLEGDFTWIIQADGTLLIQDQGPLSQPLTQPPARLNWTATIESLPPFVGHISKDRRTIVMTHPDMQLEISTLRDANGVVQGTPTRRFCARHRVMTRLAD